MQPNTLITLILAGTALLGGCASADSRYDRYDNGGSRYSGARSNEGYYGVVDSIEFARGGSNDNAVAGTIIGGVIGGVLGHQVGGGTGNSVATVAGAVGGAVVGHEIGKGNAETDAYRVRIRFDNGSYQTTTQASIGDLRVGDGVRIENGQAYRYGYTEASDARVAQRSRRAFRPRRAMIHVGRRRTYAQARARRCRSPPWVRSTLALCA